MTAPRATLQVFFDEYADSPIISKILEPNATEASYEHSIYFDHRGLYNEMIHVPLIAHVPDIESTRINDFV